jgi:thiamine-phosphate pyrophosphorylase
MSSSNPTIWRILDANFNRAREALRVVEEYARFDLNDGAITEALKTARHRLGAAMDRMAQSCAPGRSDGPGRLVGARDTAGDVGRALTTPTEFKRNGTGHVALTSCKRLTEALRGLEEYGKLVHAGFAGEMERLRYDAYEIERRLALTVRGRDRFGHALLYVLITEQFCRNDWWATAQAALAGGADALQLREPDLPDRELLGRAERLVSLCHEHSALLIVNNRADVAAASGAGGVHLGQDDLPVAAARRILPDGVIGLSTHTIEQMESGVRAVPDYLAVGPMFPSATKPQGHIAGPGTLATAGRRTALPLVAIGGIDADNVGAVRAAADCCICVCRAVIAQADVAEAAARLKSALRATVNAGLDGSERRVARPGRT